MIVCHRHKFIFVHLHSTGGSRIQDALTPLLGTGDIVIGDQNPDLDEKGISNSLAGLKKHSPARRIEHILGSPVWDSYFSFSFVRHPLDRLISLYEFFNRIYLRKRPKTNWLMRLLGLAKSIKVEELPDREPWNWPGMMALLDSSNFSEFIRSDYLIEDQGAHTQARSLTDRSSEILVDFVGKFENIDHDWKTVCERLDIDLPLPNTKAKPKPNVKQRTHSQQDLEFVYEKYQNDFDLFDYPKEQGS